MMFDDLTSTQAELIGHVKAACQAIKFLRNVEPLDCLKGKEQYEEWVEQTFTQEAGSPTIGALI